MPLNDISVFRVLTAKLNYSAERQKLIAQNVANADTPGYAPSDLKPFSMEVANQTARYLRPASSGASARGLGMIEMTKTSEAHLDNPNPAPGPFSNTTGPDSEARVDGNQVVLEDQMAKLTETRLDHEAALTFYQQSLTMLKDAAKAPGK
jgi:flagellar basal-body rod protein FlgB